MSFARRAAFLAMLSLPVSAAHADEGMWTFDAFPAAKMRADYGWAPDQAWLDKVRSAAVRLTGGCSASFVSGDGLILTNHHCVAELPAEPLDRQGRLPQERLHRRGADQRAAVPGPAGRGRDRDQRRHRRRQRRDRRRDRAGRGQGQDRRHRPDRKAPAAPTRKITRCQVVTLYGGGQYKLYTYHKYSDVRIVWAPEAKAPQFGGDPDNFNFPRYALDAAFLRAYEDGKPVATPQHLNWSPRPPVEGEATFVVGNPGSTQRLLTQDQLAFAKEVSRADQRRDLFRAARAPDRGDGSRARRKAREGKEELDGVENSLKVYIGRVKAFNDPAFMGKLAAAEAELRAKSAGNPAIGDPWADIARADAAYRTLLPRPIASSSRAGDLYGYAATLVRAAEERTKPNSDRLPGYSDSALPLVEKQLLDAKPIVPWLDQLELEWSLSKAREYLGADDPDTKLLLGKESPEGLAKRLVTTTRLADPAVPQGAVERRRGGDRGVEGSDDRLRPAARRALSPAPGRSSTNAITGR